MKYKKGITPVVVFLIVTAFAVLGTVGYSTFKTDVAKDEMVDESTSIDISDWKTYRNEKYGFEIKYPPSWKMEENRLTDENSSYSFSLVAPSTEDFLNKYPGMDTSTYDVSIVLYKLNYRDDFSNRISTPIVFNGIKGDEVVYADVGMGTSTSMYLDGKNYSYQIDIGGRNKMESDKIISTFEFLSKDESTSIDTSDFKFISKDNSKAIDTSDWKTYRNEKYGFEFRYPPTAKFEDRTKSDLSLDIIDGKQNLYLVFYAHTNSKSLNEIETEKRKYFKDGEIIQRTLFGGVPAVKVTVPNTYNGTPYDYYVIKNGFEFIIMAGLGTDFFISSKILSTFKFIDKKPISNLKPCFVGGCSSQLCGEKEDEMVSTCEWKDEYACYRKTKCERQTNGQCGWTETPEFKSCLANPPK